MTASPAPANATSASAPSAYDALSAPAVTSFLRRHALERPQHSAIVDGATGEVVTYAELLAQAEDFREAGIALGDRVGILGVNSLPYAVSLLALSEMGVIAVPKNTRLHHEELATNLQDAGISAVIADSGQRAGAGVLADDLRISRRARSPPRHPGATPCAHDFRRA